MLLELLRVLADTPAFRAHEQGGLPVCACPCLCVCVPERARVCVWKEDYLNLITVAPQFWQLTIFGYPAREYIWYLPLVSYWVERAFRRAKANENRASTHLHLVSISSLLKVAMLR